MICVLDISLRITFLSQFFYCWCCNSADIRRKRIKAWINIYTNTDNSKNNPVLSVDFISVSMLPNFLPKPSGHWAILSSLQCLLFFFFWWIPYSSGAGYCAHYCKKGHLLWFNLRPDNYTPINITLWRREPKSFWAFPCFLTACLQSYYCSVRNSFFCKSHCKRIGRIKASLRKLSSLCQ